MAMLVYLVLLKALRLLPFPRGKANERLVLDIHNSITRSEVVIGFGAYAVPLCVWNILK